MSEPMSMDVGSAEFDTVDVRQLHPRDLEAVIRLDAKIVGRRRDEFFKVKLEQALADTGIQVSLAAESSGTFVGFCLCRVYYGEFGSMERVAVLDTFGVHPDFRGQGVGKAILRQLRTNLLGLGIGHLQTEVDWRDTELLAFFNHAGFLPAPRLALDLDLETARRREETA